MLTPSTVLRELGGASRFSARRVLGSGLGTAVVYEALDAASGELVALKELGPRPQEAAEVLRADVRALSGLSHPNLARVLELLEIDGTFLVARELVEGCDLLGVGGGASVLRTALAQVARGLLALHAAGRIHGNLKPSNVRLFARDRRVVLLDPGALGAPLAAYAAPEQMERGPAAGPPADWYALGVLLHEALTGRAPFSGPPATALQQKRAGAPPGLRQLAPGAPADLEALCSELLQVDPSRRPPGEEVLRVLEAAPGAPRELPEAPPDSQPTRMPAPLGQESPPPDHLVHAEGEFRGTQRFQVEQRVGSGGMGMVYAVLDRERDQKVALKTLRQLSPHGLYLFKNEFRSLAGIRHENLVQLHELFCDDGLWFFTMELLQGQDLLAHVRAGWPPPRFDEVRLRAALPQLVRGLMALHAAGKIHRDVKPSNVMVTTEGRVVVMDFGLVADTEVASEESLIGTPHYMAPEQVSGLNVGPAADWYALGVVLYQLLTGRFPFEGSYSDLLEAKRTREPAPPSSLSSRVPEDLSRLTSDLLRMHPEARPTGEQLLQRLGVKPPGAGARQEPAPAPSAAPPERRFVGRKEELQALHRAFEAVAGGDARGILIHGESGVGKTALVRHFVEGLRAERRALVLPGRCYEQESVPYKAFDGVVDALSRELLYLDEASAKDLLPGDVALVARLFPVLERVPAVQSVPPARPLPTNPFELRTQAFAALRSLLRHASRRLTPVLVIDDLQWADQDSLALLGELFRPPSPPPFLLLTTLRGKPEIIQEVGGLLSPLAPVSEALVELHLQPLPAGDALVLARSVAKDERRADELVQESGGHPLYLIELGSRGTRATAGGTPGASLDELIRQRSEALPEAARHLLGVVAIAGGPIPQGVLARATGLPPAELTTQVSELRAADLVRTLGLSDKAPIEPYHDRVRESVRRHLPEPLRRAYHRELANALESGSVSTFASLRMLVTHMEEAGEPERAGRHAVRAADMAAQALAFDQAAELYWAALRLVPSRAPEEQQRLKIELARSLDYAARGAEAAYAYLEAAEGAAGATGREMRRKAAELLLASGRLEGGLSAVDWVLEDFGTKLPATGRSAVASLFWERLRLRLRGLRYRPRPVAEIPPEELERIDTFYAVHVGLTGVDNPRAFVFLARGFRLALDAGEELRIAYGMAQEGVNRAAEGASEQEEALDLIARARRIGEKRQDAYVLSLSLISEGMAAYLGGQFREGAKLLAEGERLQRERLQHASAAVAKELGTARMLRLQALRMAGDLQEMERSMLEYVRDAVARSDLFSEVSFVRGCAFRHLLADAPELALEDLEQKVWPPPRGTFHTQHWYSLRVRAEVSLYGCEPTGRAFLSDEFVAMRRSALPQIQVARVEGDWLWARLCLLEAASLSHLRAAALREVRRVVRSLEGERVPYAAGLALLLRSGHDSVTGDLAGAARSLQRAKDTLHGQMRLCAAAALYRLGQVSGSAQLLKEGEAQLGAMGARQPARVADVVAPGAFEPR